MRTVIALARCSHFGPTVAVTTFATLLAVTAEKGHRSLLVGAAVLAGQLSVGWSNDWLDRERDRSVGREDKPLVAGDIADATLLRAALAALFAAVPLSLVMGWSAGALHLAAVAAAWSYNLVFKRTPLSPLPYVMAFGLLPAFVTLAHPEPFRAPAWGIGVGALLGTAAHFTNVLPDLETDAATGVRGLPHRLGRRVSLLIAGASLSVALLAAWLGPDDRPTPVSGVVLMLGLLLAAGVVGAGAAGRGRLAFRLTIGAAAATVVAVLVVGL